MGNIEEIIAGLQRVTTASVADAVDRVVRRPGVMSHEIKPIHPAKIVGPAATVLERQALESRPPVHALQAIDAASPGTIVVIGMEDPEGSRDIACWGGLMATAAMTRRLGGAVLDAGVRDVEEIRAMGFPVFARSVTPSSTVGRYITVDRDVPVTCGGVRVHPGDLIVGDTDGIVVVPLVNAGEVLRVATEIEETEQRMVEAIRRTGSILRALDEFARI